MPQGWENIELGKILSYEQPTKYIVDSTDYDDKYEVPVITPGKTFILGYTDEEQGVFEDTPVIVFDDFTTASKFVDFRFKVKSSAMKILKCNTNEVNIKYVYFAMSMLKCNHDTHKRYWISTYSKLKIPLPSRTEQNRIVEKIEELFSDLDQGVTELEKVKQQLGVYKQAVLKDAYEGKLTGNVHITNENIVQFFDITGGITKNSNRKQLSTQLPYLRVANVYYNRLELSEIKTIGVKRSEIDRALLRAQDLLFVEGNGSKDQIGRVAVWDEEIEECVHQNHIIKGRPSGKMNSLYALYYLISKSGRDQILNVASSTSGLYTLSISKIESLYLPYCTMENQRRIVSEIESRLSVCDRLEELVEDALQKSEALRQSILKKAFEGKLV